MMELYEKNHPKILSDAEVLASVAENNANRPAKMLPGSSIIVRGIHDVAVRYSKCCSPVPGDEIVGFVTRGRGISIHRTDCINVINLPEIERARIIDAEWQAGAEEDKGQFLAEITVYANNRSGLLADITRTLTEKNIDIITLNTRTSKQGIATLSTSFNISGREELRVIIDKLRSVPSVIDIERTRG